MHVILINTASYLHVHICTCINAIYLSNILGIKLSSFEGRKPNIWRVLSSFQINIAFKSFLSGWII